MRRARAALSHGRALPSHPRRKAAGTEECAEGQPSVDEPQQPSAVEAGPQEGVDECGEHTGGREAQREGEEELDGVAVQGGGEEKADGAERDNGQSCDGRLSDADPGAALLPEQVAGHGDGGGEGHACHGCEDGEKGDTGHEDDDHDPARGVVGEDLRCQEDRGSLSLHVDDSDLSAAHHRGSGDTGRDQEQVEGAGQPYGDAQ
ncbi:hypothetical protein Srubr_42160 [Streptomyces rubradiris]|uniref:Uncharacterized protein n=1 Tax=Streptomyces rubradiris TaxID=285531 RepID=A0ABQ3RET9_STRRR|nr:hypothetical protein GCM10018792_10120 [Streptomyces rubradiris]GHI54370.1 hypothetical protein Srubr_42160 [Streptomyces rubradiris]